MRNEASVEIDRPIEDVFRLTTQHVADWSTIVVEDQVLEEKPDGVGTTFRMVTADRGKRMEFQGVVTRHEPPNVHAVQMTGDMFDIEATYTFEDLSGRTRVTEISNVTGMGGVKVFFLLFGWLMHKSSCQALQKELNSLKQFCEQQAAPAPG